MWSSLPTVALWVQSFPGDFLYLEFRRYAVLKLVMNEKGHKKTLHYSKVLDENAALPCGKTRIGWMKYRP